MAISEIDKYAIKAYYALHDKNIPNLGDISKINVKDIPEHDLFTYSFPCTDISVSGKQEGIVRGVTRSGLLYECEKIIEHCRPKYLLLENVKNLVGKKFKPQFDEWLEYLESLGYTSYWKVLNAKDYGVPQNRERVFVVSILGEHKPYEFPKPIPLDKCIKDILEDEVDEKYYINKPFHLVNKGHQAELDIKGQDCIKRAYSTDKIAPTLTTMQGGMREPKILCEGNINPSGKGMNGNVFNSRGISPTLTTNKGEGSKILIPQATMQDKTGEPERVDTLDFVGGIGDKDWVGDNKKLSRNYPQGNRVYSDKGIACSQTSNGGGLGGSTGLYLTNYKIRKLTPRECFRLMGMRDDDIDKIQQAGISNTQQYKMAGNSICIPVLEGIFRNLFL